MCARRFLATVVASFGLALFLGGSIAAAALGNLSYAYPPSGIIASDSLVSLNSKHQVEATNMGNQQRLLGVAVTSDSSLLAANGKSGGVQVAVNGIADVLVSTLGGPIVQGDRVGVSQINGVGMKAVWGSRVIGVAQQAFNGKTAGVATRIIKLVDGHTQTVSVGYIPVSIAIGTEPSSSMSGVLAGLQQFDSSIAGHPVTALATVVSSIVAFVALVAIIVLIYGSVRGEMISIGRNPLAQRAIFESLAQVMAMAALIVILAVITIYLTLR